MVASAQRLADMIPLGQPILVGHHSEASDRRFRARFQKSFDRGFELQQEAAEIERRAARARENRAISSDDPTAVAQLEAKLVELEAQRDRWKLINAAMRRVAAGKPSCLGFELTDEERRTVRFSSGSCSFMLTNLGAEIRRCRARNEELKARTSAPVSEPERVGTVDIERADNRVRMRFPGKPSEAIRTELKRHGFRWAPSEGAWQRHDSPGALHHARRIAELTQAER